MSPVGPVPGNEINFIYDISKWDMNQNLFMINNKIHNIIDDFASHTIYLMDRIT